MKTLQCDLCNHEASGETFREWMQALMPHYMEVHTDVMNDPNNGKAEQETWMTENKKRFEGVK